MQSVDWNEFYFVGFTILVLLSYIIARATGKGRDRLRDCYVIFAIGMLVEQISALYWGNYFGNVLDFYITTSLLFAPAVVFILIDLIRQVYLADSQPTRSGPETATIDIV